MTGPDDPPRAGKRDEGLAGERRRHPPTILALVKVLAPVVAVVVAVVTAVVGVVAIALAQVLRPAERPAPAVTVPHATTPASISAATATVPAAEAQRVHEALRDIGASCRKTPAGRVPSRPERDVDVIHEVARRHPGATFPSTARPGRSGGEPHRGRAEGPPPLRPPGSAVRA